MAKRKPHRLVTPIAAARRSAGLTALQLAERLGWSENRVYAVERGRTRLTNGDAEHLAAVLCVADSRTLYPVLPLPGAPTREQCIALLEWLPDDAPLVAEIATVVGESGTWALMQRKIK